MTLEEYIEKVARNHIGLCELCGNFKDCADKGKLKENGCSNRQ